MYILKKNLNYYTISTESRKLGFVCLFDFYFIYGKDRWFHQKARNTLDLRTGAYLRATGHIYMFLVPCFLYN